MNSIYAVYPRVYSLPEDFFQVHVKNESGQCVIKGRPWRPPRRNSKLPFVIKFAAICPFSVSFKLLGGANIEIWLPPLIKIQLRWTKYYIVAKPHIRMKFGSIAFSPHSKSGRCTIRTGTYTAFAKSTSLPFCLDLANHVH